MQKNKYHPVNWSDGMKINKSHFIADNNANTYQIAQGLSNQLSPYNYGLLPNPADTNQGFKPVITTDNQQQVQVRIHQYRAITFGGYVIQIDEAANLSGNPLQAAIPMLSFPFSNLRGKTCDYLIILSINPYERIPYGHADPEEIPPRLPYTLPTYMLQLMPLEEVMINEVGHFQLPIGKLQILDHGISLDERYIPPCASVSSHPKLVSMHADLEQFFGKIEIYALQIIQKILHKKQQNEMASVVQKICEHITMFTASQIGSFKVITLHQPPIFLIHTVSAFARLFKNTLDFYTGSGKEELINYCSKWCNVKQAILEGTIITLASHQYNHLAINDAIEKVFSFTELITDLFSKLSRLDYIGERTKNEIFVEQQIIPPTYEVQPKKRESFLVNPKL